MLYINETNMFGIKPRALCKLGRHSINQGTFPSPVGQSPNQGPVVQSTNQGPFGPLFIYKIMFIGKSKCPCP